MSIKKNPEVAAEATEKPKTPEAFVHSLPDAYVMCREIHRWEDPWDDEVIVNTRGRVVQFTRNRRCGRCGYKVWTSYSVPDMRRVKHGHAHPKDYCAKGIGRINRDDVRIESLERQGLKVR
jgi:DNA-directed RNA polymerase subunit RPC12/RpoP